MRGHVTPEAAACTVGGNRVLDSWLGYRLARPEKKHASPLGASNAQRWESGWSAELTNLLSILTQLVDLEDDMNDLLADVIAAPTSTRAELAANGTQSPASDQARRPRIPLTGGLLDT